MTDSSRELRSNVGERDVSFTFGVRSGIHSFSCKRGTTFLVFMTTRSGRHYSSYQDSYLERMEDTVAEAPSVADLLKLMIDDRRKHEEEIAQERERRE